MAHSSLRCAECHGSIAKDWSGSAHARAADSPLYLAMQKAAAQENQTGCDQCHSPLKTLVEPLSPVISEGVSCEVCHSIGDLREETFGVSAAYFLNENIKIGFRCGAKDNYFHKVGCSAQFRQSILCGACHSWAMPRVPGQSLWVFTEYNEWKNSTFNSIACQDCHMPSVVDEVAVGWEKKAQVGHHGMLGEMLALRAQALQLSGKVEAREQRISIALDIKNIAAGHKVPAGLPGRQIILRVTLLDQSGTIINKYETIYQRRLVRGDNEEAAFFRAEREEKDTRLSPGEQRRETIEFDYKEKGNVCIELLWRSIAPAIGADLHIVPEEKSLIQQWVPFGAYSAGRPGRQQLPKTISGKP